MRTFTPENATEAVLAQLENCPSPRLAEVMRSVVRHLHAIVRETEPSEAEWMQAVQFLTELGQSCDDSRNEVILMSDVLGISALIDVINHRKVAPGATDSTVLGPFFIEGTAERAHGDVVVDLAQGEATVVAGRVTDENGRPLGDASIDVWQTDGSGLYDVQQGEAGGTRARFRTGADGSYWFRTVKPVSYPIPVDRPGGRLMQALGRPIIRPAHLHFMVRAAGHRPLTTHIFVEGDPNLDADPVFGVKASLIVPFVRIEDMAEAARWDVPSPFYRVQQDFRLHRATEAARAA